MIIFSTFYGDPFIGFQDTSLKSTNANLMVTIEEKTGAPDRHTAITIPGDMQLLWQKKHWKRNYILVTCF